MTLPLIQMDRVEIREYIFQMQNDVQKQINNGKSVDDILDESQILREFESWLPQEEYGIFILTILNNFKSSTIIDTLVDSIEKMRSSS